MGGSQKDGGGDSQDFAPFDGKLSRREFLAAGAGATLAVLGSTMVLSGCSSESEESIAEELEVAEDQVVLSSDFAEVDISKCANEDVGQDLPMGAIGNMDCDDIAVMIYPGDSTNILTQMGLLDVTGGGVTSVLSQAVGHDDGYVIYDARCNDDLIVWVESNMFTDDWRVYMAKVRSATGIGSPMLVDEGDEEYDPPMLCVSGNRAFWTMMPSLDGTLTSTDSYLKYASLSDATPKIAYTSEGRMATNPQASDGIVAFVPRADTSSTRYQMTAMDASSLEILSAQVLPSSMKPYDVIYIDGSFVFSIEQSYSYGDGIANFGTYAKMDSTNYMRFNRTPLDTPAKCGSYLLVKSTKSVLGIDMDAQSYFVIPTYSGCESYGDFLLSTGTTSRIVTYTSVPDEDGSGDGLVRVRTYSLL